jgi:hypothetical protein
MPTAKTALSVCMKESVSVLVREGFVVVEAAVGKGETAIGTDLGPRKELHPASWASKGECQSTFGAALDDFIVLACFAHGGATAGAERVPTSGAGRVAHVDAGATLGAGQIGVLFWFAFAF